MATAGLWAEGPRAKPCFAGWKIVIWVWALSTPPDNSAPGVAYGDLLDAIKGIFMKLINIVFCHIVAFRASYYVRAMLTV